MKQQIRTGMFETNSSSVHALIIPKKMYLEHFPSEIYVHHRNYGWEFERYHSEDNRLSYLCQGVFSSVCSANYKKPIEEQMKKAKRAVMKVVKPFKDMGITVTFDNNYFFEEDDYDEDAYLWGKGYIDHVDCFIEDVWSVLKDDPDKIKRFVLDGRLATANDNDEGMEAYLNTEFDPRDSEVIWKGN